MVLQSVKQIRFRVLTQRAQIHTHDNSSVCSRIYKCETPGYVILWKPWQIQSRIYYLQYEYAAAKICANHK